ncbi:hypothetical protein P5641_00115 (plasmid) [Bacillus subtilis]|uniref:hypothetical protein n=1 Tax=Bacillus subtilis TaxID=1423 RepID=UPI00084A0F4B|nr:hypothetical protein [Bacillus subtilis]ODV47898.1 hypothetical protein BCM26_05685 [Bacillus subtilis]OJH63496.1 hypothetical protein BOH71_09625 [Bacillus subtilis]WEY94576.1 hypothetical protein P5641_00115 [Bacillus subtilis]
MLDSFLKELRIAEQKERASFLYRVKGFLLKKEITSSKVFLESFSNFTIPKWKIEFKFKVNDEPDEMVTHFNHEIHGLSKSDIIVITNSMVEEVLNNKKFPLFIKHNPTTDSTCSYDAPLLESGDYLEQGMSYEDGERNIYLIMGWDKNRIYFVYNINTGDKISEYPTKSLPIKVFRKKLQKQQG